jgi:hypothetical protein
VKGLRKSGKENGGILAKDNKTFGLEIPNNT